MRATDGVVPARSVPRKVMELDQTVTQTSFTISSMCMAWTRMNFTDVDPWDKQSGIAEYLSGSSHWKFML
eukprot:8419540-Pyramimonas_sp.AAC.1